MTNEGSEGAVFAIVASATRRDVARKLARSLQDGGTPCRVVCIHLIRPFPAEALSRSLAGLESTALIPANDNTLDAALPMVSTVLPASCGSPLDDATRWSDAICEAFGI